MLDMVLEPFLLLLAKRGYVVPQAAPEKKWLGSLKWIIKWIKMAAVASDFAVLRRFAPEVGQVQGQEQRTGLAVGKAWRFGTGKEAKCESRWEVEPVEMIRVDGTEVMRT